jgi:hypothetical protein
MDETFRDQLHPFQLKASKVNQPDEIFPERRNLTVATYSEYTFYNTCAA